MTSVFARTLEPPPVKEEPTFGDWLVGLLGLSSAFLVMLLWKQVSLALVTGRFDLRPMSDLLFYSSFFVLILLFVAVLHGGSVLLRGRGSFGQTLSGVGHSLLWPSFSMLPTLFAVELSAASDAPWELVTLLLFWSLATWTYLRIVLVLEKVHEIQRWRVGLVAIVPVLVAWGN